VNSHTRGASTSVLLLVTMWSILGGATGAQGPPSVGNSDGQDGPQLRVSTSASVYRQGELIPLELSFTSKNSNEYQINMAGYDRSGRMNYEKFLVEPTEGSTDPLLVYFKSGIAFLSGALTNFKFLSDSPFVMHLYLNEWVRFDKPGSYRITVTSRRVHDTPSGKSFYRGEVQELKSNSIDIRIVEPDSTWQQSELKRILAEFDSSPPPKGPISSNERLTAMTALRYLGSADAARALARHLRGDEGQVDAACMFGLIGSANRMVGYEEMLKLLVDPEFPVSETFLTTISMLSLDPDGSSESLQKQSSENQKAARSALINALPHKIGAALGTSLFTLTDGIEPGATPELRGEVLSEFMDQFAQLSASHQLDWLDGRWPRNFYQPEGHNPARWPLVKDVRLVPALRTIATQYTDFPQPRQAEADESLKLTGIALIRWYELDPESARPAVLAEIVRPKPRYSANTLGMLPDKALPNEERTIATHFLETDDYVIEGNLASLLTRYADAAVLPLVLPKIERKLGGLWACIPENNAVAYVQKVDPEAAKPLIGRVTSACQKFPSRSDLP
jgi:hypothetical protein